MVRSTRIDAPRRRSSDGMPRVLLEDAAGGDGPSERYLIEHGYDVAVCRGPVDTHRPCALLATGYCALAANADVIYTRLSWGERDCRRVLDALRAHHPRTPVVIELPHGQAWPPPHALDGRELVTSRSEQATVLNTIERALNAPHT